MTTSLLVIGYGNALRGDDGAGPCAARLFGERCAARPGNDGAPRVLVVHQLLPELVDDIAQAARVVFIDAYPASDGNSGNDEQEAKEAKEARDGAAPLRIVPLLPAADEGGLTRTAHAAASVAPAQLLALCARLYRRVPQAWLVGIPAYGFAAGAAISPHTAQRIEDAVDFCMARGGR
jgi:Ni,Fe-hydrogenase maturation factor